MGGEGDEGEGGWVGGQSAVYSTQYTVHSTQYTVHSTQYTVNVAFETYRFPKAYICKENRMNESAFRNISA